MDNRNTIQKKIIYDVFKTFTNHPSADMVYESVHSLYPSISKATVYRVLNQLVIDKKAQRVNVLGGADRFDFNLKRHYHFLCENCHMVFDLDIPFCKEIEELKSVVTDYKINSIEVCFNGVCPSCSKKEEKNEI